MTAESNEVVRDGFIFDVGDLGIEPSEAEKNTWLSVGIGSLAAKP